MMLGEYLEEGVMSLMRPLGELLPSREVEKCSMLQAFYRAVVEPESVRIHHIYASLNTPVRGNTPRKYSWHMIYMNSK